MYVFHDELSKNVKLIEGEFDEVVFDITISENLDVEVMIDFLLLYAKIVLFG